MEKNTPEKKIKAGAVNATIWKNQAKTNNGNGDGSFFTVAIDRRYKDKDGKWQSTTSFRVNDLPRVALVMQKAYEYLVLKEPESSQNASSNEEDIY
ncbi:MAG: hypothetical protein Q8O89_00860 [Nanoarchaeota archaeon]|nr:hypothetical protein [Nanoarchaeota archaeon]